MAEITKLPMLDAVRRHRQERLENGFLFPLSATSIGMEEVIHARVRRLSSVDRAAVQALPADMQQVIWDGLKEFQAEQKKAGDDADPDSLLEMLAGNEKILKTANAYCRAAFIHPRLVLNQSEITDENTWLVDDVEAEDRIALFLACMDADSPQVRKLKMFRPTRRELATDGEAVSMAEASLRAVGTESGGV